MKTSTNQKLWDTSRDAVPLGHTQITVYDVETGNRIATVFDAKAVPLIAAAPELLEALKFIEKHVCIDGNHVAVKMMNAAIAKSQGKE